MVGFAGDGVFGFHTENLTVSHVVAINNAAYGVASFDGIGTTFTRNSVSGSHDAGIYIGDSLEANAVVSHNRAWGNALGILVRHSQQAVVSDNEAWGNCIGVFLLADGQDGGSGQTAVLNNTVYCQQRGVHAIRGRRDSCPSSAAAASCSRGRSATRSFRTSCETTGATRCFRAASS